MRKEPTYTDNGSIFVYHAGRFHYSIEGNTVLVTKDTKRGIETINLYTYKDYEQAESAGYKMAKLQINA
jgi:hypothetical protein